MRLGPTWTTLIVAQVALTVAGLPMAISMAWGEARAATTRPAFAAERYLVAPFRLDSEPPAGHQRGGRFVATWRRGSRSCSTDFVALVEAEPEVSDITIATMHSRRRITATHRGRSGWRRAPAPTVYVNRVARGFLRRVRRAAADRAPADQRGCDRQRGGGQSRVRAARARERRGTRPTASATGIARDTDPVALAPEQWYEIVGVVADLQTNAIDRGPRPSQCVPYARAWGRARC